MGSGQPRGFNRNTESEPNRTRLGQQLSFQKNARVPGKGVSGAERSAKLSPGWSMDILPQSEDRGGRE